MPDAVEIVRGDRFGARWPVAHGFTGRGAGYRDLTLAAHEGLAADQLAQNWAQALAAIGPGLDIERLALVTQVHGVHIEVAHHATGPAGSLGEADAIVTAVPGLSVAVRVADCVPVLLAAPGGVAAVHAGWRGVVGGIVPLAVRSLASVTGCVPGDVEALIGPHIHTDAYEVGPEVHAALVAAGLPADVAGRPGRGDRMHAALGDCVAWQLARAHVGLVERADPCTTGPGFFSYRSDGPSTGRQAGVIAWCG